MLISVAAYRSKIMGRRKNIALFVAMIENEISYAICEGALLAAKEMDANLFILPAGIIGASYDDVEANCYRYQYDNRITSKICISDELNSKEFYVNKLNWNLEIWNLDNIVFDNDNYVDNCYPRLKKQK